MGDPSLSAPMLVVSDIDTLDSLSGMIDLAIAVGPLMPAGRGMWRRMKTEMMAESVVK